MNQAAYQAGDRLHGQYVSRLPPEAYQSPGEFFLGWLKDYPLGYVTSADVALAAVDLLNHELKVEATHSSCDPVWCGLWRVTANRDAWLAFCNSFGDYSI